MSPGRGFLQLLCILGRITGPRSDAPLLVKITLCWLKSGMRVKRTAPVKHAIHRHNIDPIAQHVGDYF